MTRLEQKNVLDLLPNEIIKDHIMALLSEQDLYNMIEVGNSRLTKCSHDVIRKRPSKYQ